MTREEIKNTPELVDFMLDESVIASSREKLHKRLDKICNLAIKALEQEYYGKTEQWILVSERLPEELMVKTLVSCEDDNGLPISTMVSLYDSFSKTWDCEYKVIAWMPLPQPYEEENEIV